MHRTSVLVLGLIPFVVLAVVFSNFVFLFAVLACAWFALWLVVRLREPGMPQRASASDAGTSFSLGDAGGAAFGSATSVDCSPGDSGSASCDGGGGGGDGS